MIARGWILMDLSPAVAATAVVGVVASADKPVLDGDVVEVVDGASISMVVCFDIIMLWIFHSCIARVGFWAGFGFWVFAFRLLHNYPRLEFISNDADKYPF